jgi:hypothetical protein
MQGRDQLVDYQVERHAGRFKAQANLQRTVILLAQLACIRASFLLYCVDTFYKKVRGSRENKEGKWVQFEPVYSSRQGIEPVGLQENICGPLGRQGVLFWLAVAAFWEFPLVRCFFYGIMGSGLCQSPALDYSPK